MNLIKLSLKDVIYNKSRTIRTFLILSFAALLYAYSDSLLGGLESMSLETSVSEETADIRIRAKNFDEDLPYSDNNFFKGNEANLQNIEGVDYTERIFVSGELDNYNNSIPVIVIGIDSEKDRTVFSLPSTSEQYPKDGTMWLGAPLANQFGVKEGDYVNISFRSYEGVYVSGEYEVSGLVKSSVPLYSEQSVFIDINEMKNLFSKDMTTSYSIKVHDKNKVNETVKKLKTLYTNNEVITYKELLKELFINIKLRKYFILAYLIMLMFIALLAIANSILISAWEKRKTTAMMRAMGFYDKDIVFMFVLEGIWIAFLGAFAGVILAALFNIPSSIYGFNFSSMLSINGETMDVGFYVPPILRTTWNIKSFLFPVIIMPLAAMIISYFPAKRSIKMSIVEAIRTKN